MPSEELRFILESIASVAGIAALIAIAMELLRARRADERDFLFHTYEKFDEIQAERRIIQDLEFANMDELLLMTSTRGETQSAFFKVFNYWDLLTKTILSGAISSKIAAEHFAYPFITYYEKYSSPHHEWFKIIGDYGQFGSFDWFAEECRRIIIKDPEIPKRAQKYIAGLQAKVS